MLLARAPPPSPSAFNSPTISVRAFHRRRLAAPGAAATAASKSPSLRVGQKRKQVASVANPLVKHCVKLRDSAAYRRSCRRLPPLRPPPPPVPPPPAPGAAPTAASKSPSLRVGQKRKQVASVANPLVKHCVKLRDSAAYRRSCRRLVLVGLAPILYPSLPSRRSDPSERPFISNSLLLLRAVRCREICRLGLAAIDCLLLLDGAEVPGELHELSGGNVVYVSATVMKKISGMQSVDSTEAIAVMHMPKHFCDLGDDEGGAGLDASFQSPKRILVLDGIQDGVFLLPACCDPFNEKALRAARGASLQLPIVSGNWCDLHDLVTRYGMKMLAGHPESSSDGSERTHTLSNELADSLMSESLCLVLGSEGNGLSEETVQACDLVSIPMEVLLILQ
uniref:tRNA/rRNA methyltransferase SpoU type domain-containing protein n=1 Tax=Aegilops tauschii TaxID=37682 RepID=M8CHM5_AEGTA